MSNSSKLPIVGITFSSIGIISGIIIFLKAILGKSCNYCFTERYGGDAYTGIQNASAMAANNLYIINKNIKLLIISMSILLIVYCVFKLLYYIDYMNENDTYYN